MHYINCPTCRMSHLFPEGGANCLPNDFKINSLLELRKELKIRKSTQMACPKHNDPLRVYCETCQKVICRDCTISEEHNKHHLTCKLLSDCYPKHHQQIQDDLDLLKQKTVDINTALTVLVTREREVVQQGEEAKKQIHKHAQQLTEQVQRSERNLLQQVDTVVQYKLYVLARQKEEAERVHTQLKDCQEMVQKYLEEWSQLQVMMEKENMSCQMKTVSQHVDPTAFQPIENADTKYVEKDHIDDDIGKITSTINYGEATMNSLTCSPYVKSTATLTFQSHDSSPYSLPPSLISCKLSSPGNSQPIKCDINQTEQSKYEIVFIPYSMREQQLIVQVGGVDISGSPFTLHVIPSSVMRVKPVKTITGLSSPRGIAVCDNGDIVVTEHYSGHLTILNKEGKKVRSIGTEGTKKGQLTNPYGVAISNDEHIFVTDSHRLQKLTFDGVCVKSVGSGGKRGCGQNQFNFPTGIAVHPATGHVFVSDTHNNRIQVFSNDLTFLHTITLRGDKSFNYPWDVSLDNEGYLYVAEWNNHCITKLTTTGEYITRFGSEGFSPGQLYYPSSLTISNNLVYVSERGNNRVSIFDTEGTHLLTIDKDRKGKGELIAPRSITTDNSGTLYVSDNYNNSIVIFS